MNSANSARELLAETHKRWSPADIAENALALADLIEGKHAAIRAIERRVETSRALADQADRLLMEMHGQVCEAHALFAAGRKAEARRIIASIASKNLHPLKAPNPAVAAAARHPALPRILFDPSAAPGEILVD
jgi:hypothetical protein